MLLQSQLLPLLLPVWSLLWFNHIPQSSCVGNIMPNATVLGNGAFKWRTGWAWGIAQWESTYLVCVRPLVQNPGSEEKRWIGQKMKRLKQHPGRGVVIEGVSSFPLSVSLSFISSPSVMYMSCMCSLELCFPLRSETARIPSSEELSNLQNYKK